MAWCTIESDPGVFTELVETMGVKRVQFEELMTLDSEEFRRLGNTHGVIFLFKWRESDYVSAAKDANFVTDPDFFFAKQTVTNACATQAILNILLNTPGVELGDMLTNFKEFLVMSGMHKHSEICGDSIGNNAEIRKAHNRFARPEPLMSTAVKATEDDDVFHFVAYLPIKGKIYELDGLKKAPVLMGDVAPTSTNWLDDLKPHIQKRMQQFGNGEIHFGMMAVVESISHRAKARKAALEASLAGLAADSTERVSAEDEIKTCEITLKSEKAKRSRWQAENIRRRHNYFPFIVQALRELAAAKKLAEIEANSRKRGVARYRAEMEKKNKKT